MRVQLFAAWSIFLLFNFGVCIETDDPLHDKFEFYAKSRKLSEPGCMLEEARWCFVFFANLTTQAMVAPNWKMRSQMCSEGMKYVECIEHFKSCAKEEEREKGMALYPYMKILQAMSNSICQEDEMPAADHKAKCDGAAVVGYCFMDFFFTVSEMLSSTQFNPSGTVCWQSQKSLQCIADTMDSCSNPRIKSLVGMLANQIKMTKDDFCQKPGCNPDAAMESIYTVRNALNSRLTDLKGSPLLCGILQYELDSVMKYINGCPQNVYDKISGGIGLVYQVTKTVCAKNPTREMPEMEMLDESRLVMTILTNPFSTKKDICPLVATAATKLLTYASEKVPAEDITDTLDSLGALAGPYCMKSLLGDQGYDCNYTQSKMCDVNRAKVCIDHAQLGFYVNNIQNLGPEVLCQEISKMAMCIEYMTAGCPKKNITIESLDPKIPQLFSMIADTCPLPSMLLARMKCNTEKCEIRQALIDCFPMPNTTDLDAGKACQFVNQSLTCVNRLTSGCGKLPSSQTVFYALKEYLNYLKPYCYHRLADRLLEMLPDCTVQYINGIRDMMYMSTNFTNDMCMFMSHMESNEKCTSLVSEMSALDLGGSVISDRPMIQYYLSSCPTDGKKLNHSKPASVKEPASCNAFSAAISASVYWHRFMMLPYLPLSERKEVCSDGPYIENSIYTMIANCSSTRKQAFDEASKMIMMVYNYFCPKKSLPMDDHSCNLNASLNCLHMLGEYYSTASSFHMEYNCMKAGMAMQCVANYTKNCSATELASIKDEIAPVMSVVGTSCENINKVMCNVSAYPEHAAVLKLFNDPQQCNATAGIEILSLFDTARPVLQNNTKLLCSLALKASMKAMKSIPGCNSTVKSSMNVTLQDLKNNLKSVCVNTSMMDVGDESCPEVKTNIGCSNDFDECFPSSSPEHICRDDAAIAACVSLKLRGCDYIVQSEVLEQFEMLKVALENTTSLTCDIVPSPSSGYIRPSFRQDMVCSGGMSVYTNYLYNDNATERDLCAAFSRIVDCLQTNVTYLPKFWQSNYFEVVKSIKKQIYFRCEVLDNLDIIYMDKPKNRTEYEINDPECRIQQAATCMDSYMQLNMFGGMMPLSERVSMCGQIPKRLMCVYNHTAACPTAVREKILRAVDWFDSIGSIIGVCKVEPKMCKPKEAMNCMSMLANGYVGTRGMGQDSLICAGLVPTEICVKNYMMGCSSQERMMMEDSLRNVISIAYKTCTPKETEMTLPDMEGECDMEKIHYYMEKLFEMGPKALSADPKTRKMKCGKMMDIKSGIEKCVLRCPQETVEKIKGLASLGDIALMAVCEDGDMKYETKVCSATALGCLRDYVSVSMSDTLSGYCRQVKSTMTCLGEVMRSCSEDHRVIAGMVVKEMKKYSSAMCEARECNPVLAHQCMTEADSLLQLSPMKFKTSPILCGGLKLALTCVASHAKRCDPKDQPLLMEALYNRRMLGKQMCPEMGDYNSVIKLAGMYNLEGMVAFVASVASPYATKESVCPQYNYMEKMVMDAAQYVTPTEYVQIWQLMNIPRQIVRGYCYEESEDTKYIISNKTAQCNVSMMMECAMYANIPQRISASIFYGWEPVCQSLEKMMCCMNHASGACTDKRSQMVVTQLYHDIFSLVGNGCSVTDVVAKTMATCPVSLPEKCEGISVITSKCFLDIRSQMDKQKICSNLEKSVSCVKEHTRGCSSYQTTAFAFGVKKYKDWMQSSCDLSTVEVDVLNNDEMSEVSNCNMQFMDSMYKTLTESNDLDAGLCSAMNSAANCYEKIDKLPFTLLYDVEASKEARDRMASMVCNKTRSTVSLPAEPRTCLFDVASVMLTSYMEHISKMTFIPLSDRQDVCSGMIDVKVAVDMLTANCSQGRRDMLDKTIKLIYGLHKEVCPSMLPAVMKMETVCLPEMAEMCINYFGMYVNGAPGSADEYTCKAFYNSVKCVQASTKSCSENVTNGLVSSLYTAKSLLGNTCPLLNGIMYNISLFGHIVQNATCNQEAATKCLTDLDHYMASEKGNLEKVCRVYPMTLACVMTNTMLCEEDETEYINSTLHTILSTTGKQCIMINPQTPVVKRQPVCSIMWRNCLVMGSTEDTCDNVNGVNISACIDEKLEGCDNITKLSLIREMRLYSSYLVMQSKNNTCHVAVGILNATTDVVPYIKNNTCDIQLTHNLTALLNNASSTWKDFCMFLDNMTRCLMMEAEVSPLVYKGLTQAAAYRLTEQKCYDMGMMNESMTNPPSNTSRVMAELMKMNMSQFYNKTTKEPESCHPETATSCLTIFASTALSGGFTPLGDRHYICSGALQLHKCVIDATAMCSPMTRNRFMFVLNKLTNFGKSQGFCQDNPEIAVKGLKGELMMQECKHDEAMECMGKLSAAISMYQYSSTKNAVCSLLLPVEMCIETHTYNCMDDVRMSIMSTYRDLYSAAKIMCSKKEDAMSHEMDKSQDEMDMSKCEMEMRESKSTMCDVPQALMCITSMEAKVKQNSKDRSVCRMLPEVKSCIKKFTSGCKPCQKDSVEGVMKAIYYKVKDQCPEIMCDSCGAMKCMMMLNQTRQESRVTCLDIWKTQQCVEMYTSTCKDEMKERIHMKMSEGLRKHDMPSCPNKRGMTKCLGEFGVLAKNLLKLRSIDLPDVSELMKMMEGEMERTPERNQTTPIISPSMQQVYILRELHRILAGHMMMNNTCTAESRDSDMDMLLMMEDKDAMCKKAWSIKECVMGFVEHLPKEIMPVVNVTLHAVGEALMDKCSEKPLRCFSCRGAYSNEECNMQSKQTCQGKNQICYADIQNGSYPLYYKGCTTRVPMASSREKKCYNGSRCMYFCDKTDCNYLKDSKNVDPPSCDRKQAMVCGLELVHSLVKSQKLDCGVVKENLYCMHYHLSECISGTDYKLFQYVEGALKSKEMVKCYAEPQRCRCGNCMALIFEQAAMSPYVQTKDVCSLAEKMQQGIFTSMLWDDCSSEEMKNMYEGARVIMTMIGDNCDTRSIGEPAYNSTCQLDVAKMCFEALPLREAVQNTPKDKSGDLCMKVLRMFTCMNMHSRGCDKRVALGALEGISREALALVKDHCDTREISMVLNETVIAAQTNSVEHFQRVERMSMRIMSKVDWEAMEIFQKVVTMTLTNKLPACEPSLAYHNCFYIFETDHDICTKIHQAYECTMVMTSGCLEVQKASILYIFSVIAPPTIVAQCNFPNQPTAEDMKKNLMDPYYNLSMCVVTFAHTMQQALSNPKPDSHEAVCNMTYYLDRCVYVTEVPDLAKPMSANMAMVTSAVKEAACYGIGPDMSHTKCKEEDLLCHVLKNLTQMNGPDPNFENDEPQDCKVDEASGCVAAHMTRILTWPYAPMDESDDICREQQYTLECVDKNTRTCSFNRRKVFNMTMTWLQMITKPGCSLYGGVSSPTCSAAQKCIHGAMSMALDAESYEDMNAFCWKSKKVFDCVKYHAYNCSETEYSYITESLGIFGNLTYFYCSPELARSVCPLTKMLPKQVGKECEANKMRGCVHAYYTKTYNMSLDQASYCKAMDTALSCIAANSSSCHPGVIEEMHLMMKPGVMSAGYNCSSLTNLINDLYTCPSVGICPVTDVQMVIFDAIQTAMRQMETGSYTCFSFLNVIGRLKANITSCNPLETQFINYLIEQFVKIIPDVSVNTCNGQLLTVAGRSDPWFNNYTMCAKSLSDNLTKAMMTPEYGFYDICRSAAHYKSCITQEFKQAKRPGQMFMQAILNQTTTALGEFLDDTCASINASTLTRLSVSSVEKSTCKANIATGCVVSYATQAMYIGVLNEKDMMAQCGAFPYVYQCFSNYTKDCSSTVTHQLQTLLMLSREMVLNSGVCPKALVQRENRYMAMYVMEMLQANKQVDIIGQLVYDYMETKEKYMMEYSDEKEMADNREGDDGEMDNRMEDGKMDDRRKGERKMCMPVRATYCAGEILENVAQLHRVVYKGATFCSEMEKVHQCVERNIEGCDDTTKAMALQPLMIMSHVTKILCSQVQEHLKMMYMRMNNTDMSGMRNNTDMSGMRNNTDMSGMRNNTDMSGMRNNTDMSDDEDMAMFDMRMNEEEDEMEDDFSMMDMKKNIAHNVMSFMVENDMMKTEDVAKKIEALYAIAPEDGECVDPQKYREHAECVPSLAMQCMNAVDMEMLHPLSTRERLCLKYSVATRCYMMTAQSCDYVNTLTLASTFEYLKYKVGDRCPTVVKSPCQDVSEKRCRVHEVEECLTELYQTLYAGKYFLPSSIEPMCQSVHKASECMMKKVEHCDARVNYTLYDSIRPSMTVLDEMCTSMPALGCVTSFMWKSASILFLTMDIDKMGSEAQKIEYMKAMNMTIPNDSIDKMLENEDGYYDSGHMNAENMEMVMKWLQRITDQNSQCDDKEMKKDKYGMDNILHDMGAAIKYVFMDAKMTAWDPQFKAAVEMAVKSDDIIMTMVRALGTSLREYRIPYKESEIMQSVIRYVVSNSDSTKVLEFYFSKLVKAKIDSLMPVPKKEKDMEKEMEEMMMDWIKKEIVAEIRDKMEAVIYMRGSLEKGMKFLHKMFEETKMKKMSMCLELMEAAKCMESFSHLIPHESKPLVNLTMSAIGGIAHALCEPTKCFSCSNQRNNYQCNKQGLQTCDSSQGCSVTVRNGMISKSCAYSYKMSEDPENFAMYCSGSYCNSPAMETDREYEDSCKPMKAIQCLYDIVPSVFTRRTPDMRLIYKAAYCIEESTERCVVRAHQELGDVGMRLKHSVLTGICSGNMGEYQCGLRSVLHLSATVNDPMSSPTSICSELNETISLIQNAYKNNLCSDYEMMLTYQGLQTIFSIIGPYTCPNIMVEDKSFCPAELMNMKSSGKCDLEGAEKCLTDLMMDEKIAMITTMEPNEKDHLCRDLWTGTFCVMPKILSCSEQIQKEIGKNITERLMIAINHCPAYKSVHENCMQEPQYKTCQVGTAISTCLSDYFDANYNVCQLDEAKMTSAMHCLMTYMDGCTVMQGTPVAYLLEHLVSTVVATCGSRTPSRMPMTYSNMMMEMVTQDIMAYTSGVMPDSWRKDMPVTKMFDVMLQAKMIQMRQKDFNTTEMFYALPGSVQNATSTIVNNLQMAIISDETAELAKCSLQFVSRLSRSLMYPDWTQVLLCEGLTATQKCLASLELSPVAQMNVWNMMDKIEGDREMLCQSYMEHVMYLGSYLTNRTAQMMNTTMSPRVYSVIEHMMNGSLATSNITRQDVLLVFNSTVSILDGMFLGNETCDTMKISTTLSYHSLVAFNGPFTSYMDHPAVCYGIYEMEKTIIPEIRKCSIESQSIYNTTIDWIKNRTNHICKKGEMIIGEKTCNVDGALDCLQYIMPYIKSMSTSPEKLCSKLHMALICLDLNTKTCKPEELKDLGKAVSYVMGIVGNSCPYVTALTTCYADVSQFGNVCNASKAIMCTYTLGVDPSKPPTSDICGKLPPVLTCIQRNMSGCTNSFEDKLSVKAVMSFLEVGMMPINKVCSREEIAKNLYSQLSCTAPLVCSFKEAFKCYEKIKGRETCSAQEATDTKACVMNHLKGCNPVQQSVFNATAMYHRSLYPGCKAYEIDLSVVSTDMLVDQVGINYCMSTFKDGLSQAITTPEYALPLLCHAFKTAYECLHTGMDEKTAAGWDNLLGAAFKVTANMVSDICENVPTITREALSRFSRRDDTPGCSLTPAANALATYTVVTGFSSGLTQEDKRDYCNMNGSYASLLAGLYSDMSSCTEEEKGGLTGLKTMLHAVRLVSNICSNITTTCSPRDAANCGVEVKQMMEMRKAEMTDRDTNRTMWNEEYCQMAKYQLQCVNQYTYGCSKEVHAAAVMKFEEDYCLVYDLISNCPALQMPMSLEKLPECVEKDDRKADNENYNKTDDKYDSKVADKEESCDVGAALECFVDLRRMLLSPFKDCRYMKRAYTNGYRCFDRYTEKCPEAAWVVLTVSMRAMGKKVADTCPDLPLHSCLEPPTCQADEAFMCLKMLTGFLHQGKLENSHVCSAMDLTGMCMHEKVRDCSGFMTRAAYYYYESTRKAVMKAMNLTCEATLDTCAENAYQSSIAIIHGETVMAKLLKKKSIIVDNAMDHMMRGMDGDIYDQMDMIAYNMTSKDENSVNFIDIMAKDMMKMMTNDTKKTSSDYLMHFYTSIMKMMTREMADFRDVYTKVKVLQCMSAQQASSCVAKHLNSSSLRPDTMNLVTRTMTPMYDIVSGMCEADSQCSVMEEPDSCMILQASVMTMMQNGYLMMNKTHFCKTLPYTIEKVKNMTDDCSPDLRENFGSILSSYKNALDTSCRVQHRCEEAAAQKCIDTFTATNRNCSLYETTLTCVTTAIKGCNSTVTGKFTRMLEEARSASAANCETLPAFRTNASTIIRVVEGGPAAMLQVIPSESPSSQCEAGKTCEIKVKVEISQDSKSLSCPGTKAVLPQLVVPTMSSTDGCSSTITDNNWREGKMIWLKAQSDLLYDGVHDVNVSIIAEKYSNGVMVISRMIKEYQVVVRDTDDNSFCSFESNVVSTFDKKVYTNGYQGEFVLYKHKIMPYEVRTLSTLCTNKRKACMCAVIIKIQDFIIIYDKCQKSSAAADMTLKIYMPNGLPDGTKIYTRNAGKVLNVNMPTGTMVQVREIKKDRLSVLVQRSSLDWKNTEGLCGFYDGEKSNDWMMQNSAGVAINKKNFILGWRKDRGESLLKGTIADLSYKQPRQCTCSKSGSPVPTTCADMLVAQTCQIQMGQEYSTDLLQLIIEATQSNSNSRRKRQAQDPFEGLSLDLDYQPPEATWPTPSNWTEAMAEEYCNNALSTSAAKACQSYLGDATVESYKETCILSIQENDGTTSFMETMTAQCQLQLYRLASTDDSTQISQTLSQLCENDCSNNGDCRNATCTCYRGWIGADCSISESTAPVLQSLENGGLCTLDNTKQCNELFVVGENFASELRPSCHFEMATAGASGYVASGNEEVHEATFISSTQMICTVPTAMATAGASRMLFVSVSNNGQIKSQPQLFVSYNPMCYDCDASTKQCSLSSSGCVIADVCYEKGDVNPATHCQFCDPVTNKTIWTHKIVPNCPGSLTTQPPISTTTSRTTTTPTTTTPVTTTPTTAKPTTNSNSNSNCNQGQVGIQSTEAPSSSNNDTPLIIVSIVAGVLLLICIILSCKMCHEKDLERVERKKRAYSAKSTPPSSIEDSSREYDNFAYDPNQDKKNVYQSGLLPGDIGGVPPKSFPPYNDKVTVEDENLTKL